MVYVKKWTDFVQQCTNLYESSPSKTRYSIKFRPKEGVLVLKLTDDSTCLKHKTKSSILLNRFESLNTTLMEKMMNRQPPPPLSAPVEEEIPNVEEGAAPMDGVEAPTAATPAGAAPTALGGGGKNKKKKGKKK